MTNADTALWGFTVFNGVRVLAYVPQMMKIRRDTHGASAISLVTWALFALSHGSTVVYAVLVADDPTLAAVFGVNSLFCLAIVALTVAQRRRLRRATAGRTTDGMTCSPRSGP